MELLVAQAVEAGRFGPVNATVVAEAMVAVLLRFTDPEFVGRVG